MNDLGPDARALLAAARHGDDPTSDDADRIRAKLGARLAAGAAAGTATALATKTTAAKVLTTKAAAAAGAMSATSKVAIAVAVVGATTATGAVAMREQWRAPEPQTVTVPAPHRSAPAPRSATVRHAPTGASVDAPRLDPLEDVPTPSLPTPSEPASRAAEAAPARASVATAATAATTRAHVTATASTASTTRAPAAATPRPEPVDTIRDEAALLQRAREALARGDAVTALARVDEHAARFPGGVLAIEREAARVHGLCASGRDREARAAASAFVSANPRSPLAPSVGRSCATRDR